MYVVWNQCENPLLAVLRTVPCIGFSSFSYYGPIKKNDFGSIKTRWI